MSDFKFWGWDKKPRTMLRFIKLGDIFCFRLDEERYCFGRIISKIDFGHIAEIFDYISTNPIITEHDISSSQRLIPPIIINTYGMFDNVIEPQCEWRIIGHQNNYQPTDIGNIHFVYGDEPNRRKVDIFGNECGKATTEESSQLAELSPKTDYNVKQLLKDI